jgi:predicted phage terminase large subunit-like protein
MTRFFESDLAGMLLEREPDWEVVCISAECESTDTDTLHRQPSEFLWPGPYGYADMLREVKKTTLPEIWSALYQGRPSPDSGSFFLADYFKPMTVAPRRDDLHVYGASDYAVSAGRGDFSVHVIVGQDSSGQLFLLDCWRKQAATDESIEAFCDLVLQWKPMGWACEKGQLANSIEPFMKTRQRARNAYVPMEMFPTRGDKSVRCQAIRARLSLGGIFGPTQAEWWPAVRSELLSFPVAPFDDAADSLGLIGQILDRMSGPHVPTPKPPNKTMVIGGPSTCSLTELFEANESRRGGKSSFERIK